MQDEEKEKIILLFLEDLMKRVFLLSKLLILFIPSIVGNMKYVLNYYHLLFFLFFFLLDDRVERSLRINMLIII
jgi:hypothetical protein